MKATIEDNNGNANVIEADSIIVIAGTRNGDKEKMETGMIGDMSDVFWRFVPDAVFKLASMSVTESSLVGESKTVREAARVIALTERLVSASKEKMGEIIEKAEPDEALAILAATAMTLGGASKNKTDKTAGSLASLLSGISDITS